jgi:alkylated DNA repair dioxygenase AlkB
VRDGFMAENGADAIFDALTATATDIFGAEDIKMFGKTITAPRTTSHWGAPYRYAGVTHPGRPFTGPAGAVLDRLRDFVADVVGIREPPQQVMLNSYENGKEYIGMHSDDEKELNAFCPVVMISFGAGRLWKIESKKADPTTQKKIRCEFFAFHGQMVIMHPGMQKKWKHGMPQCSDAHIVKHKGSTRRISITFRWTK